MEKLADIIARSMQYWHTPEVAIWS